MANANTEVLEILGDVIDGRIGTQFAGDEIVIHCGLRTPKVVRRIVRAVNAHDNHPPRQGRTQ